MELSSSDPLELIIVKFALESDVILNPRNVEFRPEHIRASAAERCVNHIKFLFWNDKEGLQSCFNECPRIARIDGNIQRLETLAECVHARVSSQKHSSCASQYPRLQSQGQMTADAAAFCSRREPAESALTSAATSFTTIFSSQQSVTTTLTQNDDGLASDQADVDMSDVPVHMDRTSSCQHLLANSPYIYRSPTRDECYQVRNLPGDGLFGSSIPFHRFEANPMT